jgi:hypothetical protein
VAELNSQGRLLLRVGIDSEFEGFLADQLRYLFGFRYIAERLLG